MLFYLSLIASASSVALAMPAAVSIAKLERMKASLPEEVSISSCEAAAAVFELRSQVPQ
jgi:hypothetical protein